jgi:hypothetical protein
VSGRARWYAAAFGLVALFVVARAALVARSYDSLANWEEPAFLYSGVELGNQGLSRIFDYQDDLSHGGSLPLVAIAVPWVRTVGWRLDLLKGIAVLWSAATLAVLALVGIRFVSPGFGLLVAALYATSPSAAMLQATLVGSHPEAALFVALALGAHLHALGRNGAGPAAVLGACCGLAAWCSYLAAPWSAALAVAYVARRPRHAAAAAAGAGLGIAPWAVQNLVLRPHGAIQWVARAGVAHAGAELPAPSILRFPESLAGAGVAAAVVTALLALAAVYAVATALARRSKLASAGANAAVLPAAAALVVSALMLSVARLPEVPREGFYYFRFFVPLQLALFWLAAAGVGELAARRGTRVWLAGFALTLAAAVGLQAPLYRGSNSYRPDAARDFAEGCTVFGHAEVDRARSDADAAARLAAISDESCRRSAFTGYGWRAVSRYAADGDVSELGSAIDAISDSQLRDITCRSASELMAGIYEQAMTRDRRETGSLFLDGVCTR